jgi:hypothetical protein
VLASSVPTRGTPRYAPDEETELYSADGRSEWVRLPLAKWTASVAVEEIDAAERALRRDIKARGRELKPRSDETMAAATARIARLLLDVAEENAAEFLSWTSRLDIETEAVDVERRYPMKREADGTWTRRYLGPDPKPGARGPRRGEERRYRVTSRPQQRRDPSGTWVTTDTLEWSIEQYDAESDSWKPLLRVPAKDAADAEQWLVGDGRHFFGWVRPTAWRATPPHRTLHALREPVGRMLRGEMGKAGKDGRCRPRLRAAGRCALD